MQSREHDVVAALKLLLLKHHSPALLHDHCRQLEESPLARRQIEALLPRDSLVPLFRGTLQLAEQWQALSRAGDQLEGEVGQLRGAEQYSDKQCRVYSQKLKRISSLTVRLKGLRVYVSSVRLCLKDVESGKLRLALSKYEEARRYVYHSPGIDREVSASFRSSAKVALSRFAKYLFARSQESGKAVLLQYDNFLKRKNQGESLLLKDNSRVLSAASKIRKGKRTQSTVLNPNLVAQKLDLFELAEVNNLLTRAGLREALPQMFARAWLEELSARESAEMTRLNQFKEIISLGVGSILSQKEVGRVVDDLQVETTVVGEVLRLLDSKYRQYCLTRNNLEQIGDAKNLLEIACAMFRDSGQNSVLQALERLIARSVRQIGPLLLKQTHRACSQALLKEDFAGDLGRSSQERLDQLRGRLNKEVMKENVLVSTLAAVGQVQELGRRLVQFLPIQNLPCREIAQLYQQLYQLLFTEYLQFSHRLIPAQNVLLLRNFGLLRDYFESVLEEVAELGGIEAQLDPEQRNWSEYRKQVYEKAGTDVQNLVSSLFQIYLSGFQWQRKEGRGQPADQLQQCLELLKLNYFNLREIDREVVASIPFLVFKLFNDRVWEALLAQKKLSAGAMCSLASDIGFLQAEAHNFEEGNVELCIQQLTELLCFLEQHPDAKQFKHESEYPNLSAEQVNRVIAKLQSKLMRAFRSKFGFGKSKARK